SLSDVNRLALMAGDSIDFKRGATCQGTLSPSGSGDPSQPVQIGAYGPGTALPAVAASGPAPSVKLANQQNLAISDLELSGGGIGVTATASDYGAMRGITLRGLDIHDVTDGIVLQAAAGAAPSALDDVRILGNRIHGISGSAVTLSSNWCRRPDVAP